MRKVFESHKINLLYKLWLSVDTFQDILTENKEIKDKNKEIEDKNKEIEDELTALKKRLDSIEKSNK